MTNLCTKVTVRKRPIKNGQTSLYLDFYPPIRNPKTGRLSRREYLGLYIYSNPTEKFQQEYNRSIMQKAELIKCRRTESIINEEFGFLDRSKGQESFLDYFKLCMNKTQPTRQTGRLPTSTSSNNRVASAASATSMWRIARSLLIIFCRQSAIITASR